jgi:aryl-alcohol dehydrogenase-like predicted oxidoreductase
MNDFSEHTSLGASGLEAGKMGIGADAGISARALEWAFERGINYFYWGSRRRPGMKEAIRKLARSRREKMIIALQTYDYTGLALRRTFMQGLRALEIDYADVMILGNRNGSVPRRILDKALALKERGLARHLCVSAHDRSAYRQHLDARIFDLIMVRYNAAHRGAEQDVFPLLGQERRPGVICYNSTRWGHLFDPRWMPQDEELPSPTDLYRYVLSNPNIDMVLTAPETMEQDGTPFRRKESVARENRRPRARAQPERQL